MTGFSPRRLVAATAAALLLLASPAVASASGAAATSPTGSPTTGSPTTASPPTTAAGPPASSLPARRLYVQGDSVMVGALAQVTSTLRADGWAGTITGFIGLHTYAALPLFQQVRPTMGSVAVIELGANDCCDGGDFGLEIDKVMRILAGLHVIWLTMPPFKPGVAAMNQALWAATHRWADLQVADWAGALAAHPGYAYPDSVHLKPQGSALLASYIRSVLDAWYDGPERTYSEDIGGAPFLEGGGWLPAAGTVVGAAAYQPPGGGPPGFWAADSRGGVYTYGAAPFEGSAGGRRLTAPVVGMAATPDGAGYWLVGADGGVFTFGDAGFYGSEGGRPLSAPIVGMAATPDGRGYWLAAADGGVFSFGDAGFYGSAGASHLASRVVSVAATPDGAGYWLAGADGGVFSFGDAGFFGSAGGLRLDAPVAGITASPDGAGYWLVAADGGVFSYGDAGFSGAGRTLVGPEKVRADYATLVPDRTGGYWLVGQAPALADAVAASAPSPASEAVDPPAQPARMARRHPGPGAVAGFGRAPAHGPHLALTASLALVGLLGGLVVARRRQVAARRAARLAARAARTAPAEHH